MEHERYWLRYGTGEWMELTQRQFVDAEHAAGFYPKPGLGPLATAGFDDSSTGAEGRITHGDPRMGHEHEQDFIAAVELADSMTT